jgi:hypothetical protein
MIVWQLSVLWRSRKWIGDFNVLSKRPFADQLWRGGTAVAAVAALARHTALTVTMVSHTFMLRRPASTIPDTDILSLLHRCLSATTSSLYPD